MESKFNEDDDEIIGICMEPISGGRNEGCVSFYGPLLTDKRLAPGDLRLYIIVAGIINDIGVQTAELKMNKLSFFANEPYSGRVFLDNFLPDLS